MQKKQNKSVDQTQFACTTLNSLLFTRRKWFQFFYSLNKRLIAFWVASNSSNHLVLWNRFTQCFLLHWLQYLHLIFPRKSMIVIGTLAANCFSLEMTCLTCDIFLLSSYVYIIFYRFEFSTWYGMMRRESLDHVPGLGDCHKPIRNNT